MVTLRFGEKFRLIAEKRIAGLFLAYLLWVAIGAIYSNYPDEALQFLTRKIPFAVWPILMSSVAYFTMKDSLRLVHAFVYAMLVAVLFSFSQSIYQYVLTGDDSYLYFSELIYFKRVPPHYFGMYLSFAYGVVFYRLLRGKFLAGKKWLSLAAMILFFVAIIFSSVRMQYLVFGVLNMVLLFGFQSGISLRKRFMWGMGALAGLALFALLLPGSRSRLVDTVNEVISFDKMVNNKQTNPRKFLWRQGWEVIKENLWLGTGTGAEDPALQEKLAETKALFWDGDSNFHITERGYNYHNVYLQHWAAHGMVGLVILLAVLLVPFWLKSTPPEARIFLLVCGLSFITESMLQRQAGVLFFTFFYGLFFFLPHGHQRLQKQEAT
ncbi:MAG: O-antigen ligase family protein [Owenweeksia sp.]|nr:O-antigen ligase family protein [Owenweeksia sp.]